MSPGDGACPGLPAKSGPDTVLECGLGAATVSRECEENSSCFCSLLSEQMTNDSTQREDTQGSDSQRATGQLCLGLVFVLKMSHL